MSVRVGFESVRERACVYVDESDLAVVQCQCDQSPVVGGGRQGNVMLVDLVLQVVVIDDLDKSNVGRCITTAVI